MKTSYILLVFLLMSWRGGATEPTRQSNDDSAVCGIEMYVSDPRSLGPVSLSISAIRQQFDRKLCVGNKSLFFFDLKFRKILNNEKYKIAKAERGTLCALIDISDQKGVRWTIAVSLGNDVIYINDEAVISGSPDDEIIKFIKRKIEPEREDHIFSLNPDASQEKPKQRQ